MSARLQIVNYALGYYLVENLYIDTVYQYEEKSCACIKLVYAIFLKCRQIHLNEVVHRKICLHITVFVETPSQLIVSF